MAMLLQMVVRKAHLHSRGKCIIFSSDKQPKDMEDLIHCKQKELQ